ncbi:preprotein translocase subunit SecG [Enterococcus hirae]|nr:preprotein translocase subunit SecG [Enterococcaceae bacterium]MCI1918760.1 preprotein translocase subunit SecG [Enterococcaceae bacterium]MDM8214147.1 preprotein translocase subunit SecG [Enterococcus hirae]
MYNILLVVGVVLSILLVIAVMMQPSKQNSAASAFSGSGGELFGKQKARGFEAFMKKATWIMGVLWIIDMLLLAYLSSK